MVAVRKLIEIFGFAGSSDASVRRSRSTVAVSHLTVPGGRRGRLERGRLGALPRWPTDGRLPGRVVCVGGNPPPVGVPHPLVAQRLWRRLWRCDGRCDAGAVDGAARRVWGRARAERGAPQLRASGDGEAHSRRRAAGARPSRAHRAGRAALAWVAAHASYVCMCSYRIPLRGCGGRADRRAVSVGAAWPPHLVFANGWFMGVLKGRSGRGTAL